MMCNLQGEHFNYGTNVHSRLKLNIKGNTVVLSTTTMSPNIDLYLHIGSSGMTCFDGR